MSDPYYLIDRQENAGVEVLRLSGDLDINARADITDAIRAAVGTGRPVEVDFSAAGFLDSEGLAGLIEGYAAAQAAGRPFRVVGATGIVRQVLTVTGVLDVFDRP